MGNASITVTVVDAICDQSECDFLIFKGIESNASCDGDPSTEIADSIILNVCQNDGSVGTSQQHTCADGVWTKSQYSAVNCSNADLLNTTQEMSSGQCTADDSESRGQSWYKMEFVAGDATCLVSPTSSPTTSTSSPINSTAAPTSVPSTGTKRFKTMSWLVAASFLLTACSMFSLKCKTILG